MGTRNLTAVQIDGGYKVAQYGQWDGYPEGQGLTCLAFARRLSDTNFRKEFERKVRAARWITQAEIDAINTRIELGELKDWTKAYPELYRDTGGKILRLIAERDDGIVLRDGITFAADGLFCEWAWVIDLDANTFEGYRGFNETHPLTPDDRFYFLSDKEENGYHGVRLAAKWSLDALPGDEDFIKAFAEEEAEDD